MLPQYILVALVAAASAVPLNINLGAYSPALVVGDGEISLGSTESASELMATLASGATQNGEQGDQQQQGQQEQQPAEQPEQQEGEQQQGGENRRQVQPTEEPAARARAVPAPNVRTVDHIGKRAPSLEAEDRLAAVEAAMAWIKRDLEGFNAALTYAREAMQNTPKIEMGTENAGVGLIQNAGLNVPANSAANGAGAEKKVKRGEVVEESESPKMTLVAITEV
ncbi:hypothetical protein CC78DRAFT_618162 [Lojkania enalia]|uniref:Uncharacterized protein n=1 Tax=Lojkania enalia TaxID=147567 RepID=A0A9P4K573_9PLEO|nr:hypothetical protein CC78DRAFT_618162 [Didymosphaeria enalia]